MPHLDGIEAARQLGSACLRTRVVLLSEDASDEHVAQCRRAGAVAFIAKGASGAEVLEVLLAVLGDRVNQDGGAAREMLVARSPAPLEAVDVSRLTARERQILSLVAEGHSSVGVAAVLEISVRTVETHRQNIMEKLGVHSVVGLTRLALRMGLV
jgi:DNA-binding NarL/FixJ family response regulator